MPVRSLHDKEEVSSSIGEVLSDSHYVASPEPNSRALDSHHSYVSSRYSDRYQPSTYISSYVPPMQHYSNHEYNPHTTTASAYTSYRPTSAKDYSSRYTNFYSGAPAKGADSTSFLITAPLLDGGGGGGAAATAGIGPAGGGGGARGRTGTC